MTLTISVTEHNIRKYRGIVSFEVIAGTNIFRNIGAVPFNFSRNCSMTYGEQLQNARNAALV